MWAQQMEVRQQVAEAQRRGLPPGPGGHLIERPGQYL